MAARSHSLCHREPAHCSLGAKSDLLPALEIVFLEQSHTCSLTYYLWLLLRDSGRVEYYNQDHVTYNPQILTTVLYRKRLPIPALYHTASQDSREADADCFITCQCAFFSESQMGNPQNNSTTALGSFEGLSFGYPNANANSKRRS